MIRRAATILFPLLSAVAALGGEDPVKLHLGKAREHWGRMEVSAAVAEWKRALVLDPANETAKKALARLRPAFERTDEFLKVVEDLLAKGLLAEAEEALKRWTVAYASRDQQARVLMLKGRMRLARGKVSEALTSFKSAEAAASSPDLKLRARLGRGRALVARAATRPQGAALLRRVAAAAAGTALAAEASWARLEAREMQPAQRMAALSEFLKKHPRSPRASAAHRRLAGLLEAERGGPSRASLGAWLAAYGAAADLAGRSAACGEMSSSVSLLADRGILEWLAGRLAGLPPAWDLDHPPGELAALAHRRVAVTCKGKLALKGVRAYQAASRKLVAEGPADARRLRWRGMAAEGLLMEGQLLLLAGSETEALGSLFRSSGAYQKLLRDGDRAAGRTLLRIGRILESRGRPDGAAHHYGLVARSFAADPLGADSLWRLAAVYRQRLDMPLRAIDVLVRYQDRYPPSFRVPTTAQDRIRKLGYPDVASFQAAHGLKSDSVLGPNTLKALRSEEQNFREVLPVQRQRQPVRGRLVHGEVFAIARDLAARGRFREAVRAYQSFLSMYPGHRLGDDALLAVARILRRNDLFEEAAAAYGRLIADYPKGDGTSHAYLEAAYCWECLGQWQRAERLYDMFLKKFPHYRRSGEARRKLAAVRKVVKYAGLIEEGSLPPAKMADALYEMGRLLYKQMGNRQKAAEVFTRVADKFTKTYHAPDARFSAGACMLHEQNFAAAREQFSKLAKDHPASRLADDAQFWIGHTCEYQARALGKLDHRRIVLRRRSALEAARLRADLELRRLFRPSARAAGAPWHQPHPDLFKSGRTREKVQDGLREAVAAYRKVVAKHRLGDMAQRALLRTGAIYSKYLNDPDKAIEAYRDLLEKYPGSPEAVDAQFAVGKHYLENKKLAKAEKAAKLFLTSFPNHAKAADALLLLAECHRRQKKWVKALDDYQSFLARYPRSPRAQEIREEVEWLKKYRF